ncbi:uncharacterized protein DUF3352 [Murinocardiopsis flavida]|uniref:Uncharacterized protein DUF3352 n=1 Tax=Murinocardiopsis flavida TaxID=645275 RepID=A0A2P8CR16_9ACTN|nr:DUF3352 domain-containing protein [Murinocardiopsis flavida]PSK87396.1 uncharacterized protein DUF3352 [Murinocardiopsis flavida]
MSYPDPAHQQQPWHPQGAPAPQQQAAYYQQQPPRGRGPIWMIPVAAVAAVAVLATTVWASDGVVDDLFGGPSPDTVLPSSSFAYFELDFKPDGGQIANYAQFVQKLPDVLRDELDEDGEDPLKPFVEDEFDYLDYDTEVQPWLGKRVGAAAWESEESDEGEPAVALAVAVTDEDAARPALDKMQSEEDDFAYELRDGFALLAESDGMLRDLAAKTGSEGTLDGNQKYVDDIAAIGGGNLATAWADIKAASDAGAELDTGSTTGGDPYSSDPFESGSPGEDPELSGRMAMGLRIEADYLEARADLFDFSVDGISTKDLDAPEAGIDALGNLPDDTIIAIGGGGVDKLAQQAWKQNEAEIRQSSDFADFEEGMNSLGVRLPKGFTDLLGSQTAFGVTGSASSLGFFGDSGTGDVSFEYRATGGDVGVLENLVGEASGGGYGTPPGVSDENGTAVVSSGSTGTGKLGTDPVFQSTMEGLEDSNIGLYMDLRAIAEDAGESGAEQWGALGGSFSYDDGGNISTIGRWAPSNS